MLSHTMMGVLALGILWVNTLLVAAAALGRARELRGLRQRLSSGGVFHGKLASGAASLVVEQVGRQGSGATPTVVWHDRSHACRIDAVVERSSGDAVVIDGTEEPMVWLDSGAVRAAALPGPDAFDRVFEEARKAKGSARTLEVSVTQEAEVWASRAPALIATIDPIGWCRKREAVLSIGFVPAIVILAAGVTALTLYPPVFGTVSTVGGALGLAFFLLVLPAGTAMRDWARAPHERFVRGRWSRPTTA